MSLINNEPEPDQHNQQDNPPDRPEQEFPTAPNEDRTPQRTAWSVSGLILAVVTLVGLSFTLAWYVSGSASDPLPVAARELDASLTAAAESPTTANLPATNRNPAGQASTNAVEETPPVATPELKLQGIFFTPKHPAAVINGSTLHVGDRVNGFRVIAITPQEVRLANTAVTNVLSLSQ